MSHECCPDCKYFIRKLSLSNDEKTILCHNSLYINEYETCLSKIGKKCNYFTMKDHLILTVEKTNDEIEDDTGGGVIISDKRRFQRIDTFKPIAIVRYDNDPRYYSGVAVDISTGGLAVVLPKRTFLHITQGQKILQFDIIIRIDNSSEIKLRCECCRIEEYTGSVQIGLSFLEPLAEELKRYLNLDTPK